MSDARARPIPQDRLRRSLGLGRMASSIAGRVALDGLGQLGRGKRPALKDLILTPANARKVADQLAQMRGAAMKMGQLLSLEGGDVLPQELTDILARLRAQADVMPPRQLREVLDAAWGKGWLSRFAKFDVRPIAAASIGQVHRARTRDERDLAIKVQYPGVRRAINSDVDNVAALIRLSGLVPEGMDLAPLLATAKAQLHEEADYEREARYLQRFHQAFAGDQRYLVPTFEADFSTGTVLAMSYVHGRPIDALATGDVPQGERDRIMTHMIDLLLTELFDLGVMQTDPNFANFLINDAGRIILLDFGAAREVSHDLSEGYKRLLKRAIAKQPLEEAAMSLGVFGADTAPRHRRMVLEMIETAVAPLREGGVFDFADTAHAERLRDRGMALGMERDFTFIPPHDLLFLQRKIAGMYLLGSRLKARVDVGSLLARHIG